MIDFLEDFTSGINERAAPFINGLYGQAVEAVRSEHPEYFIEYKAPRNAREKIKLRSRQQKIYSRAKKQHYAVESKLAELGGSPLNKEVLGQLIVEQLVVMGRANEDDEIAYLEARLES